MSEPPAPDVTLDLVGFSDALIAALGERLDRRGLAWRRVAASAVEDGRAEPPAAQAALARRMARGEAIVVTGDRLDPERAAGTLRRLVSARGDGPRRAAVVLAAGPDPKPFEPLVAADAVFYLSRRPPAPDQIARLLDAARRRLGGGPAEVAPPLDPDTADLVRDLERQTDDAAIAGRLAREMEARLAADVAFVWFYDRHRDLLWRPTAWTAKDELRRESAAAGLAGYTARTGDTAVAERAGEDPRFDPEADNDGGDADQRLLAVAVAGGAVGGGEPIGVLVALRAARGDAFSGAERRRLEDLARRLGPTFDRVLDRAEQARVQHAVSPDAAAIFRAEALEHYTRPADLNGRPLELSPTWMQRASWLLVAAALAAIVFALLARVEETIGGPAVVRIDDAGSAVFAVLPASARPLVAEGMPVRVRLDGFGDIARSSLDRVSGVIGPDELRRQLDPRVHHGLDVDGSAILIRTRLDGPSFESGGRRLDLHDGLPARVDVVVGSQSVLSSLLPGSR